MKQGAKSGSKSKASYANPAKIASSTLTAGSAFAKGKRLVSLDALRGLIMILMAVDHANYFITRNKPAGEFWGIPLPQYKSTMEFLTRFITHPCAPGFFFLMGVSMILFAESRRRLGWTEGKIIRHFLLRGILLIIFQQLFENPAWYLGPTYQVKAPGGGGDVWFHCGVLFGLGATMIIGALLLRFGSSVLISLSLITIIIPQLLLPDPAKANYLYSPLLRIVLIPGQTGIMQVFYTIIPWLGLMGFGLVFGKWLLSDHKRAYRRALMLGIVFILLFLLVRIIGGFGNIHPPDGSGLIAFLNVTKYPPSIAFILLTLGVVFLLLVLFSRTGARFERWGKPLLIFGRTALFFYIVHLYIFAIIGLIVADKGGTSIPLMYAIWLLGLVLLYILCWWYGKFKKRKPTNSIWRLF